MDTTTGFLLLLLLLPAVSKAQKIEEDKVDPFNGNRRISTKWEKLSSSPYLQTDATALIIKQDNLVDTSFLIKFFFRPGRVTSMSEDQQIILKLKDGSTINHNHFGKYKIYSSDDIAYAIVDLEPEDIEKINKSPIDMIRIETSNYNYDYDLKDDKEDLIPKLINLVIAQSKNAK